MTSPRNVTSKNPRPQIFRIEPFGSCEYNFVETVLRSRGETLELLESAGAKEGYSRDIEKYWKGEPAQVSLLSLRLPTIMQIEYTYKCPLKCKYCYSSSAPERNETMDFDKFKNIVTKVNNEEIFDLDILGGEPFVQPEYLHFLLENIHNKYITISTNGLLVTKESCEWIKNSDNFVIVSFGVDGPTAKIHNSTRGGFDKMLESVRLLKSYDIPLVATTCVTKYNQNLLEDLINFLIDEDIGAVQLLPVQITHLSEQMKTELSIDEFSVDIRETIQNLVKRYQDKLTFDLSFRMPGEELNHKEGAIYYGPCTAGVTSACINANGNLAVCPPVQDLQIPIDSTIEEAFLSLKNKMIGQRKVLQQNDELMIQQSCSVLGYGQKCAFTR